MIPILIDAPLFSLTGYGSHIRDIVKALHNSGKFLVTLTPECSFDTSALTSLPETDIQLFNGIATQRYEGDDFIYIFANIPYMFPRFKNIGKRKIIITAGIESDSFNPAWKSTCDLADTVLVSSNFVADGFRSIGVNNVQVIEEGVNLSLVSDNLHLSDLDSIDTEFNFVSGGQWQEGSVGEDRKQIGLLLDFFFTKFKDNPNIGLVLKTHQHTQCTADYVNTKEKIEFLAKAKNSKAKVYLLHGNMTDEEMFALYRHNKIHAFISFTSGEGWGRMMAEAASVGLPVLATNWSGHTHFLQPELLIKCTMKEVPRTAVWALGGGVAAKWAMVDLDDASYKVDTLRDNYPTYKYRAELYSKQFLDLYSDNVVYTKLVNLLCEVYDGKK